MVCFPLRLARLYLLILSVGMVFSLWSQTPPNPTADRGWNQWWYDNSVADVEAEFNAARRNEESQRGLASGTLGNLNLPSDYLSRSAAEQALIILNAERTCRDGVNYPSYGVVSGLPVEGVELDLNTVAQGHANWMSSTGNFSHTGSGGSSPWTRMNVYFSGCTESMGENIAWNSVNGSGFILGVPLAFYGFIYDDGSCCNWGHRQLCLKQTGNNNYGDPNKLGLVGFGRAAGGNGDYFVMDYLDPTPACTYDVTNYEEGGSGCPAHVDVEGMIVSGTFMADQTLASNGTITGGASVDFQAGTSITLESNFTTNNGAELIITIDDCTLADQASEIVNLFELGASPTFKMGNPVLFIHEEKQLREVGKF